MNENIFEILEQWLKNNGSDDSKLEMTHNENISVAELDELKNIFTDFSVSINHFSRQELKKEMEFWNDEMDFAEMKNGGAISESNDYPSRARLEESFSENKSYSPLLRSSDKSNLTFLVNPDSGFEWNTEEFEFTFSEINDQKISYQIENNQQNIIFEKEALLSDNKVIINFDYKSFLPGRYYLKFIIGSQVSLIEFFIRKDLIPV